MALQNYYKVLGLDSSAQPDEIKNAYRKLVRQYHPDRNQGNQSYEERFKLIREAYEVLSDTKKRDNYDAKLAYDTYINNPIEMAKFLKNQKNKPKKYRPEKKESSQRNRRTVIINSGSAILVVIAVIIAMVNFIVPKNGDSKEPVKKQEYAYNHSNSQPSSLTAATEYLSKAKGYINEQNFKLAMIYFQKALDNAPDNPEIYFNRGLAHYIMKNHEMALKDFNKTIELQSDYKNAFWIRAKLKYDLDDNTGAIKDFSSAIMLDPKNDSLYFNRGLAYFYSGNYEKAVADIDMAIQINPDQPQYYFDRGDAKAMTGEMEGCSDWLKARELGYYSPEYKIKECITAN